MRQIHLHGALGRKYGPVFTMDVASVAQAIRGLTIQIPGFRQDLEAGAYRVVRKSPQSEMDLGETDLGFKLGQAPELHFYPVIGGAKDRGAGKIILGVALVASAFAFAPAATGGKAGILGKNLAKPIFGGALGGAATFGAVGTLGAALILGGIAQSLAPTPRVGDYSGRADEKPSFLFNGPVNVNAQGVAVPVVYGRMRVGSVVVSAGLTTEEIPA